MWLSATFYLEASHPEDALWLLCLQEGNADTLQMERQTEEEARADFIAKALG